MCVCVCVCVCMCVLVCVCVCVCVVCACVYLCVCMCVCICGMFVYVCVVRVLVCVCVSYMCMCVCVACMNPVFHAPSGVLNLTMPLLLMCLRDALIPSRRRGAFCCACRLLVQTHRRVEQLFFVRKKIRFLGPEIITAISVVIQ